MGKQIRQAVKSKLENRDTMVKVAKANLDAFEMDQEEENDGVSDQELSEDDIKDFNKKTTK